MIRSDINSPTYLEVKDSATLQEYGKRNLSTPGSKSKLNTREFIDLLPVEVLARKEARPDSKTIAGISTKFEYVCKVINIISLNCVNFDIIKVDGTLWWRRFPCFCFACAKQDWKHCSEQNIVGELVSVRP